MNNPEPIFTNAEKNVGYIKVTTFNECISFDIVNDMPGAADRAQWLLRKHEAILLRDALTEAIEEAPSQEQPSLAPSHNEETPSAQPWYLRCGVCKLVVRYPVSLTVGDMRGICECGK